MLNTKDATDTSFPIDMQVDSKTVIKLVQRADALLVRYSLVCIALQLALGQDDAIQDIISESFTWAEDVREELNMEPIK